MSASTLAAVALASQLAAPLPPPPLPASDSSVTDTTSTRAATVPPARASPTRRASLPRPPSARLRAERLDRKELRGARTMIAVGGALFGVFYLGGTLAAATELDRIGEDGQIDPSERDARRVSQLMMIPVAGPLVAAPFGEDRGDKAALAVHGVIQGIAAGVLIGGAVRLARDRRARRLEVSASPMLGGGTVSIRGRF